METVIRTLGRSRTPPEKSLLAGKGPGKRREFFYWTDDGNLAGLRYDQYKAVFLEQQAHGLEVWMQPFVPLRAPKLFNLRSDPFERAEQESGDYVRWFVEHIFVLVPAQAIVAQYIQSFQEFPPRQKPGSFSVDRSHGVARSLTPAAPDRSRHTNGARLDRAGQRGFCSGAPKCSGAGYARSERCAAARAGLGSRKTPAPLAGPLSAVPLRTNFDMRSGIVKGFGRRPIAAAREGTGASSESVQGRNPLASRLEGGRSPKPWVEFAPDSPLEGDGFELSVPGRKCAMQPSAALAAPSVFRARNSLLLRPRRQTIAPTSLGIRGMSADSRPELCSREEALAKSTGWVGSLPYLLDAGTR
jgi:hypothetical protein